MRAKKLFYIDNLRILLISLIVSLHIAITYGADGSWYYYESTNNLVAGVVLTLFAGIVQSFALGFFYMISGYFTPGSYERKGGWGFIKDRFLRLGIPFFVYFFVISPALTYTLFVKFKGEHLSTGSLFGSGPLWFVQVLFVFAACYALWRRFGRRREASVPQEGRPLGHRHLLIFAVGLSLANFVTRIWFPLGWSFSNLQFSYFPGYIAMFIVGIAAYRNRWFETFSDSVGRRWLVVAIVAVLLFPVMAVVGGGLEDTAPYAGGLHWQSMMLSTWEAFLGTALIAGLFVLFRGRLDHQGNLAKTMAENAYAVYIIHAPVVVFFAYSLRNLTLHPLLKFILVAPTGVALCFLISNYIVRKIPLAERIL